VVVIGHTPYTRPGREPIDDCSIVGTGAQGVQRRKLLATAGALSATAFATTVALGANLGLFGITEPHSSVGRLDTGRPAVSAGARVGPVSATAVPRSPEPGPQPAPDD
jgi:hypothetical protein